MDYLFEVVTYSLLTKEVKSLGLYESFDEALFASAKLEPKAIASAIFFVRNGCLAWSTSHSQCIHTGKITRMDDFPKWVKKVAPVATHWKEDLQRLEKSLAALGGVCVKG